MAKRNNNARQVPQWVREYVASLRADKESYSELEEIDAGVALERSIARESDEHIKEFMREYIAKEMENRTLLSHILLDEETSEQRQIKERMLPIALFIALEDIVAREADSSAYTKQYFSSRRHPLRIPDGNGYRNLSNVDLKVSPLKLARSYYKLGSHFVRVGRALTGIIEHLEERYGLDFHELERQYDAREERELKAQFGEL